MPGTTVRRCSYLTHFSDLWLGELYQSKPSHRYIIDWQDTPPDGGLLDHLSTRYYLTPIDWAACFAEAVRRNGNVVQVVILDYGNVGDDDKKRPPLFDHYRRMDKDQINWLRILPAGVEESHIEASFSEMDRASGWVDPGDFLNQIRFALSDTSPDADRHAITNTIGPIILLGGVPEGSGLHSRPLVTLLQFAGLLPHTAPVFDESAKRERVGSDVALESVASVESPSGSATDTLKNMIRRFFRMSSPSAQESAALPQDESSKTDSNVEEGLSAKQEHVEVACAENISDTVAQSPADQLRVTLSKTMPENFSAVLIDDQSDAGWETWLKAVLPVSISTISKPGQILEKLDKNLERMRANNADDLRYEFSLNDGGGYHEEILLLDLRLFTSKEMAREQEFCRDILKRYESWIKLAKKHGKNGPWPALSDEQIKGINRFCEQGAKASTADHIEALTLLARFISLLDASYPIVLFSSTGQSVVFKSLAPYGNIITDFEKPRFFGGTPEDIFASTHAKFEKALMRAMEISSARKLCAEIGQSAKTHVDNRKCGYIEIYMDESSYSESPYFNVVGLLVGYPNCDESVESVKTAMSNAKLRGFGTTNYRELDKSVNLLPHGLDFRFDRKVPPEEVQAARQDMIMNVLKIPEKVGSILVDNGCFAVPFAFYRPRTQEGLPNRFSIDYLSSLDRLCDDNGIDNTYQSLVHTALEALLFEVSVTYLRENGSVSVFCATRQRHFKFLTAKEWEDKGHPLSLEDKADLESRMKQIWEALFEKWGIRGIWEDLSGVPLDIVDARGQYSGPTNDTLIGYGPYFEVMKTDCVYSIVDMLFRKHVHAQLKPKQIKFARATTLTSDGKKIHPKYRNIHYVADIIGHCNDIKHDDSVSFIGFDDQWKPAIGTIGERCSDSFRAFLTVGHLLESGSSEDCTLALLGYSLVERKHKGLLDQLIISKLAEALTKLTGSDFLRFIELRRSIHVEQFGTLSAQALSTRAGFLDTSSRNQGRNPRIGVSERSAHRTTPHRDAGSTAATKATKAQGRSVNATAVETEGSANAGNTTFVPEVGKKYEAQSARYLKPNWSVKIAVAGEQIVGVIRDPERIFGIKSNSTLNIEFCFRGNWPERSKSGKAYIVELFSIDGQKINGHL